jgi:hypothetical protein
MKTERQGRRQAEEKREWGPTPQKEDVAEAKAPAAAALALGGRGAEGTTPAPANNAGEERTDSAMLKGAASWRTPICRRALGLLLLDWSSEVLNHSPDSVQARWETLSVKQDSCLWWRVRGKDTTPNAPNAQSTAARVAGSDAATTSSTGSDAATTRATSSSAARMAGIDAATNAAAADVYG